VASNSYLASAVGVEMLRRGGNAIDAAVATGFALSVTHPEAGSLGGGGFLVLRFVTEPREPDGPRPDSAIVAALDFRETAPAAARRDMFLPVRGRVLSSTLGYHAVAVPGLVAGLAEAHSRYGRLPLEAVIAPAIRLAEDGFVVDSLLARSLLEFRGRVERSAASELLLPGGTPLAPGDTLRQWALARTLQRISVDGPQAFYRGPIAAQIAADVRRNGGILTAADLANYRAVWREPVSVRYRGHTVVGAPLPSSGLLTAGKALMILEALGPPPQFGSAQHLHSLATAMQLAFVDRMRLGDPGTTPADAVAAMLDRDRAERLARSIPVTRAVPSVDWFRGRAPARDGPETTHWSAVDEWGNAVAVTSTINNIFGSGSYVAEAGIFLSDTMDDFNTQPAGADQWGLISGEANTIAAGKRPLSSMTPFVLLDPDGRLLLVAGARGGPRIISNVLQLVTNVVDHGMLVTDAISAPRIHQQALPDQVRYEAGGFGSIVLDSLRAMGHNLAPYRPDTLPYMGRAVAIGRGAVGWIAVVDPRFGERSAGY
jgi:gamma-glutamyltranspeptidase / glutathione hydrolase